MLFRGEMVENFFLHRIFTKHRYCGIYLLVEFSNNLELSQPHDSEKFIHDSENKPLSNNSGGIFEKMSTMRNFRAFLQLHFLFTRENSKIVFLA